MPDEAKAIFQKSSHPLLYLNRSDKIDKRKRHGFCHVKPFPYYRKIGIDYGIAGNSLY